MKKGFQNSIFKKMILGICLPTIIIYGIAVFSVLKLVEKPVYHLMEENLKTNSQVASSQVGEFFARQKEVVKQMSANCEFQDLQNKVVPGVKLVEGEGFKNIERTLDNIHSLDPEVISAAWVADEDSSQLYMSNDYISDETFDIHQRPWFIELEKTNSVILSEPYIDVATNKLITTITAPIFGGSTNKIIGAVGLDFSLESLDKQMSSYTLGEKGFFVLVSKDGTIIYHPNTDEIGKTISEVDLSDNIVSLLSSKQEGNITYDAMGETVYGYVSNVGDTGWSIISGLPEREFHQTLSRIKTSIGIILAVGIALLAIFIFLISLSLVKPLRKLSVVTNKLAEGHLDVEIDVKSNDEIGSLASSMQLLVGRLKTYIDYINEISDLLKRMGQGELELNFKQTYDGEFALVKQALVTTSDMLNETLSQINVTAEQVASGSDQVSSGAQALSQGATEQASSIEELSATMNDISTQIQQTAENALRAKEISVDTNRATMQGKEQMQQMISAMEEISNTSTEIGKIIKNIDDIAFQTNILALNAAVEAARAGSAGKGFAVVADEVRNLAGKSAESAKTTAILIENAVTAIENGTKIVAETAKSLEDIVEGSQKSTNVIQDIANASDEQAHSMNQVNLGVEQISAVVQTNSASAEESAATSEELSAQAQMLKELISRFKLKETNQKNYYGLDDSYDYHNTNDEDYSDDFGGKY